MLNKSTKVVVNRPKHFSHLLRAEIVERYDDERWTIKAAKYFNNEQSNNPAFSLRTPPGSSLPQAELVVRTEYLIEDTPGNQKHIDAWINEALDA